MNCYLQNAIFPTIFCLKKIDISGFINASALIERNIALKFRHRFLSIILFLLCKESFLCGAGYLFAAPASIRPAKTRADCSLSELFAFQPPFEGKRSNSSESQSSLFGIHSEIPESQSTIVLRVSERSESQSTIVLKVSERSESQSTIVLKVSERSERRNTSRGKVSGASESLSTIAG